MTVERLLSSADRAPSGTSRGCPPRCEDTFFPRFTDWRLRRRLSREALARELSQLGFACAAELFIRIETRGQRPNDDLVAALAALMGVHSGAARWLFEEAA